MTRLKPILFILLIYFSCSIVDCGISNFYLSNNNGINSSSTVLSTTSDTIKTNNDSSKSDNLDVDDFNNKNNINTKSDNETSQEPPQINQGCEEENTSYANFVSSINCFYKALKNFDTMYMFGYFQSEYVFKEELVDCNDLNEFEESTNLINNATQTLLKFVQDSQTPTNFEIVLNDDYATNLLNNVYNHLFTICNLKEKLKS